MFDEFPGSSSVFDFDELADHLVEQGEQASPSELHGCLTGQLAAGGSSDPAAGLDGLNQTLKVNLHGELAQRVQELHTATLAALRDEEFAFHPLLPDDEVELDQRVLALGLWCRGFMAGYARATAATGRGDRALPGDAAEILKDIATIGQVGVDDEAGEEESEGHYAELVEYLRFATLNVYMDGQASAPGGCSGSTSLH
jgi:uncharacterized protein YgfB (UPF0149 family)